MSPKSFLLSSELHEYLLAHSDPIDEVAEWLIVETAALGGVAQMQVAPEQGALLTLLTRLIGTSRALEIGTFTGYSSLCIARGLAADGRLLCCDISEEWTGLAREAWQRASVEDRIELRVAPAIETVRALPPDPVLDLAFIDADKGGYADYFAEVVPRLRPGGLLLVDNTLWGGRVLDPDADDPDTTAIRAFNRLVADDKRVDTLLLPVADGLTFCQRRA